MRPADLDFTMCATVLAAQSNQALLLGNDIGDSTAQRVRLALGEVDPPACIVIDLERPAVWVGISVSADDVLASLLGAGVVVQAWAAELPIMDGYVRRTRRRAASV